MAVTLTPKDIELLALVWQCFDSAPKVRLESVGPLGVLAVTDSPLGRLQEACDAGKL